MEDYRQSLSEYGLSDNEINVYVTSIKLRESSAQNIAKNAELPRTTVYHILDSLIEKGLMGFVLKGSIKYFQAVKPSKIIDILDQKKKMIASVVPELDKLFGSMKEKPNVSVFEGLKGIKSVLKDVLEEKKIIYHYGDIISLQNVLPYAFPQYINERVKRKIPIRILCKKEELHKDLIKSSKKEYREFIFIPEGFVFKTSVFIYAGKVAIFNIKEEPHHVIVINNKDFYETQKNFFELTWKLAKK
jgi:sugar-specific transcriptional regulator TrmB